MANHGKNLNSKQVSKRFFNPLLIVLLIIALFFISQDPSAQHLIQSSNMEIVIQNGHNGNVACVTYSPDGSMIASSGNDGTIKLWDANNRSLLKTFYTLITPVTSIAFSPDGNYIAGEGWNNAIHMWDTQTGELKGRLTGHRGAIRSIDFHPGGSKMASGSVDGTIRLWNIQNFNLIRELGSHPNFVSFVKFNPQGTMLATTGDDSKIKLWDLNNYTLTKEFIAGNDIILSLDFSPDGNRLVSTGKDLAIRLWDVPSGQLIAVIGTHQSPITCVEYSPDGRIIATGGLDAYVKLWDAQTYSQIGDSYAGHFNSVLSLSFNHDGRFIVVGSIDNKITILDSQDGHFIYDFKDFSDPVLSLCYNSDGSQLAISQLNRRLNIWDTQNLRIDNFILLPRQSNLMIHKKDDQWLFSNISQDNSRQMSSNTNMEFYQMSNHNLVMISQLSVNNYSKHYYDAENALLAVYFMDGTVKIWNLQTNSLLATITENNIAVQSLCLNSDARQLLCGKADGSINIWDIDSRQLLQSYPTNYLFLTSIKLNPNKTILACGYLDGTIKLLNYTSGRIIQTFEGHNNGGHTNIIYDLAFHPNNNILVSGSYDTSLKFWDLENNTLIATLILFNQGEDWILYTPDNYYKSSLNGDQYIMFQRPGTNQVYSFQNYQSIYKRPDVLAQRFNQEAGVYVSNRYGGEELQQATANPPEVFIQSPRDNAEVLTQEINLEVEARCTGDVVKSIAVKVNGRPGIYNLPPTGLPIANPQERVNHTFTITLMAGENNIEVQAYNSQGVTNNPEIRRVTYNASAERADLYILAAAVNDYPGTEHDLSSPVRDVQEFVRILQEYKGDFINEVYSIALLDNQATMANIIDESAILFERIRPWDIAIIYFAGHGSIETNNDMYYFCTHNVSPGRPTTGLPWNQISDTIIGGMLGQVNKILLILDTCHSGYIRDLHQRGARGGDDVDQALIDIMREGRGTTMIASTMSETLAFQYNGYGLIALCIQHGIELQEADDGDGIIHLNELTSYIKNKGYVLSDRQQYPQVYEPDNVIDYPLVEIP